MLFQPQLQENLSAHGASLLSVSFNIWLESRKTPLCSDQRHPWAPGLLCNLWNPWHPHSMLSSASHSSFCCSSLFPSKLLRHPPPTKHQPSFHHIILPAKVLRQGFCVVDIHFQASQCLVGPEKERKEVGMISCFPCPARVISQPPQGGDVCEAKG